MTDAVLIDNHRKAELSFAYLAALSAMAGYTCQRGPQPDVDSIDATVRAGGSMRPMIDVQLKATSSPTRRASGLLALNLDQKNYNDLRVGRTSPAILVCLELPNDPSDWLHCDANKLVLRRCAWWESILDYPEIDTESKDIVFPEIQRFDLAAMQRIMELTRQNQPLKG